MRHKNKSWMFMLILGVALLMIAAIASAESPEPILPDQAEGYEVDGIKVELLRDVSPMELDVEKITWRCKISEKEVIMLAQTIYAEAQSLQWNGDFQGMSYRGRQAAVAWCALNRLDNGHYGDSLEAVLSAPNQFAWRSNTKVTEDMYWLAEDVLNKWWAEKCSGQVTGRTLPSEYLFFVGSDGENYFRREYDSTDTWDWTFPDPYKEGI